MSKSSRLLGGAAAAVLASFALVTTAEGKKKPVRMVGKSPGAERSVVSDRGTAFLSVTHSKGPLEFAAGNVSDKNLGMGALTYVLRLLPNANGTYTVTSKHVVLYTGNGRLSGTATATVTLSGTTETVTGGKLTLTKGFGSLAGDRLIARFTGTGDVSANQLAFAYKGKLTF